MKSEALLPDLGEAGLQRFRRLHIGVGPPRWLAFGAPRRRTARFRNGVTVYPKFGDSARFRASYT